MPNFNQTSTAVNSFYQSMPVFVNGIEEAERYPVVANSTAIFLDRNDSVFYIKSVDRFGYTTSFKIYDYVERAQAPEQTYVTKDEFKELCRSFDALREELGIKTTSKEA